MLSRRETTEAQWEFFRNEIHTLYLGHNKALKDVMTYMKEQHNFNATWVSKFCWIACSWYSNSKAQYERHFKIWNFRKNLNDVEWKFVHHRIEKRKRNDKGSVLQVDGIAIPNKRVKKEISRHSRPFLPTPGQCYTAGNLQFIR